MMNILLKFCKMGRTIPLYFSVSLSLCFLSLYLSVSLSFCFSISLSLRPAISLPISRCVISVLVTRALLSGGLASSFST
jgi:hypothetical protein